MLFIYVLFIETFHQTLAQAFNFAILKHFICLLQNLILIETFHQTLAQALAILKHFLFFISFTECTGNSAIKVSVRKIYWCATGSKPTPLR